MQFARFRGGLPRALLLVGSVPVAVGFAAPAAAATPTSPATTASGVQSVRQKAPALPPQARVVGAAPGGQKMALTFVLAPSNPRGAAAYAADVSDPTSALYHLYLTPAQWAARFGASPATAAEVRSELQSAGMTAGAMATDRLSIKVSSTTAAAQALFHTTIGTARLADGRLAYTNTSTATLPAGVEAVAGLDDLVQAHDALSSHPLGAPSTAPSTASTAPTPAASAHTAATLPATLCSASGQSSFAYPPAQIATAYDIGSAYGVHLDGTGATVALVELADYANSDLTTFENCLGLTNQSVQRVPVDGGASVGAGTTEATFDIDQIMSLAPGASIQVYEGVNSDQGLFDLYSRVVNDNRASVISTSWGLCEASNDPAFLAAENTLFQQAAAQGQTVLAASGDSGSEDCYSPGNTSTTLQVDDPSSQPYVTGVGGTSLTSTSPRTESVWNSYGGAGGGGISHVWPMPSYQQPIVNSLSSSAACGVSSGDCREVPDISASADPNHGYVGYCTAGDCGPGGGWRSTGGTSMAAPLWASLIALVNQGCPATRAGFLNPSLYSRAGAAAVNDITAGSNDLTGTNAGRYQAVAGYDMASGLGTPDTAGLLDLFCPSALTGGGGSTSGGTSGGGSSSGGSTSSGGTTTTTTNPPTTTTWTPPTTTTTTPTGTGTTPPVTVPTPPVSVPVASPGYRFVAADGGVFAFGSTGFFGSTGGLKLAAPIVGTAMTPDGKGYWLVASDGGVFSFGDAKFYGSTGALDLAAPVVAMAATPDGRGYWLVASDGGVFSFGDAPFLGSAGKLHLSAPIVGMAVDPATAGYWLVGSDGGIFSFGAPFYGSTGNIALSKPIVGMSSMPDGLGYRFVAADGGVFSYGGAAFLGSTGATSLAAPVVGLATTADGLGYWLVGSDGGVFSFGDAPFLGSTGAQHLAAPVVGVSGI